MSAAGFQLKGSGWYATDFRGGKAGKPADADDADEDRRETDAKPDAKTDGEARRDARRDQERHQGRRQYAGGRHQASPVT